MLLYMHIMVTLCYKFVIGQIVAMEFVHCNASESLYRESGVWKRCACAVGGALGGTISGQEWQGSGVTIPSLEGSGSLLVCL